MAAQPNAIATFSDHRIGCVACGWRKHHEAQPNELDDDSILSGLRRLNDILAELEEPLTEMDENLLNQIIRAITVPDDEHISFHLIGGLTITEATHYNRRCRRA